MFPNPFGNPAIEVFNKSVADAFDNTNRIMSMQSKSKAELHKECQASDEDLAEASAIIEAEHDHETLNKEK